jgi:hypothetical protein
VDPRRADVQRDRVHRHARRAGHARPGFLAGELSKRENAEVARQLDAAISGGLRPTTLIHRVQPHSRWKPIDFALYEAHAIYKAETSSTTGYPIWLTRSLDPAINWQVQESKDQADAVLDEWDKANADRAGGVTRHVVPIAAPGHEHLLEGGLARQHHFVLTAELERGADPEDESAGLDIDRVPPPGGYSPQDYGDSIS